MKSIEFVLMGIALSILGGCGGGGSDTPPEARTLQLMGDSTLNDAADGYSARYGAGRVFNGAVAGTASAYGVALLPTVRADVLLVNYGANDAVVDGSLPLVPIDAYRVNLRRIAAAPARVVFATPNAEDTTTRNVGPYAQAMREVAVETGARLIDVEACMLVRPDWRTLLIDGVHPSPTGHTWILMNCVAPVLDGVLR